MSAGSAKTTQALTPIHGARLAVGSGSSTGRIGPGDTAELKGKSVATDAARTAVRSDLAITRRIVWWRKAGIEIMVVSLGVYAGAFDRIGYLTVREPRDACP